MTTFITPRMVRAALATAATLALTAGAASAATVQVTIDFGTSEGAVDSPYTEDGFAIAGTGLALVGETDAAILLDAATSALTLTRIGGGAFSLVSFDLFDLCQNGQCPIIVGGLPFSFSPQGPGAFNTFSPDGLTKLTSLSFFGSSASLFQLIDNIVLTYDEPAVVPVPAALPLLLAGLGGLGLMARRKRRPS